MRSQRFEVLGGWLDEYGWILPNLPPPDKASLATLVGGIELATHEAQPLKAGAKPKERKETRSVKEAVPKAKKENSPKPQESIAPEIKKELTPQPQKEKSPRPKKEKSQPKKRKVASAQERKVTSVQERKAQEGKNSSA